MAQAQNTPSSDVFRSGLLAFLCSSVTHLLISGNLGYSWMWAYYVILITLILFIGGLTSGLFIIPMNRLLNKDELPSLARSWCFIILGLAITMMAITAPLWANKVVPNVDTRALLILFMIVGFIGFILQTTGIHGVRHKDSY